MLTALPLRTNTVPLIYKLTPAPPRPAPAVRKHGSMLQQYFSYTGVSVLNMPVVIPSTIDRAGLQTIAWRYVILSPFIFIFPLTLSDEIKRSDYKKRKPKHIVSAFFFNESFVSISNYAITAATMTTAIVTTARKTPAKVYDFRPPFTV